MRDPTRKATPICISRTCILKPKPIVRYTTKIRVGASMKMIRSSIVTMPPGYRDRVMKLIRAVYLFFEARIWNKILSLYGKCKTYYSEECNEMEPELKRVSQLGKFKQ